MVQLIPRLQLFEIEDQSWFPDFLRARVQDALALTWTLRTPLQSNSPAEIAANVLVKQLGKTLSEYAIIDFCAGGGGPTPSIEHGVNTYLRSKGQKPANFILTDLHPNVEAWERITRHNSRITYECGAVDASAAPRHLVEREDGKKTLRLFNLSFHHFDDELAQAMLRDTVETRQGFAIFELQDRSFSSAVTNPLLGLGVLLLAPWYAWKWRSLATLAFSWFIPILPFVLVFDAYISGIRTRTPGEVELLLRGCGADTSKWEIRSGSELHLWPCGYVNWILCKPVE